MSTNNTVLLHDVNIPALNSVGYADGLHSALTSIENNESLLANRDFVKGDRGDSVDIEKIDLNEYPELFELLKSTIKGGLNPQPIGGVSWDSLLSTDLYVINKTEIENGVERYVPISSLYYTFVDGRFVNDNVGNLSAEDFADESDLSCILVYEDGEFKKLSNIFPNMYFEDGHGLCWMVNGQRTGLPVQGVPGKDGRNSDILIVKVKGKVVDENGKGEVEETWNKLGNWSTIEDKESMDGYSCFALAPTEEGATAFYAGKLTFNDGVLYVICKPELSLQQTFDTQTFINVMQNISIKPNPDMIATPPGLFVPMKTLGDLARDEAGNVIENQPVHFMTATSINNEVGNEQDLMTDMVVTPVNTTALTIDTDHDVKVDKYLYVRMSDEVRPLVETKMNVMEGMFTNYKLKFKLSNILLTPNVQRPIVSDEKVYFQTEDSIDVDGSLIVNNLATYDNHNKMIPADFRENITKGIGIYVWSLDLSQDSFDPDNTLYAAETAPIKDIFPVVYTKTMTPGIGDDILWFNGLIVDEENLLGEFCELFEGLEGEVAGGDSTEEPAPAKFMMRATVLPSMPEVGGDTATDKETNTDFETDWDDNPTTGGDNTTGGDHTVTPALVCPVCGRFRRVSDTICSTCGEDFDNPSKLTVTCKECGEKNPGKNLECWNCSSSLKMSEHMKTCPTCSTKVPPKTATCPTCGYQFFDIPPITETTEICPGCGTENTFLSVSLDRVCSHCQYDFIFKRGKICPNCEEPTTDVERTNCENCNYNFYTHEIDEVDINAYIGKVTGYIMEAGEPAIGATVKIPGARFGTQTDVNGYYSLPVTEGEFNTDSLEITYIGFDTITIEIQHRNRIDIDVADIPEPELPPFNPSSVYKLLRGTDRKSLIFDKFVPIYVNSYRMDRDTSYNLNYNVNITGDEINPKRTLSVYGDINCENINVYELTATGEIKNIYTKDTIVSDSGIDLRDVDADGKVVNKTSVTPYEVNTTEVYADDVNANTVSSNQLKVLSTNVDIMSTDGKSSAVTVSGYEYHTGATTGYNPPICIDETYSDEYDEFVDKIKNDTSIDVNNVRRINIRRGENFTHVQGYESDSYDEVNVSVCKTDLPVVFENDASIIVSNNRPIEDIMFHGHYGSHRDDETTQFEKTVKNDASCTYNTSFSQQLDYIQNHYVSSYSNTTVNTGYSRTSPFIMFSGTGLVKSRDCSTVLHNSNTTGKLSLNSENLSRLLNSAICYYKIDKFDGRKIAKFDIKFSKKYELVIETGSKCSYGNWPHLHTDSYMEFDVLAEIDGNIYRLTQEDKATYKFDYTGSAWCGYEHKDGDYKTRVRSYVFGFNPYDIEIQFSDVKNKSVYNLSDSEMTIYVVPTGRIYFTSDKKTINYITCTLPRPSSSSKGTASNTISRNVSSNPRNFYTRSTPSKSAVLNTTLTLTTDGVSSFTICGDGFSVLSGSKAFGFGNGNLFNQFRKNGDGYWGTYKDDLYLFCHEVINPEYCQQEYMKAIPFSVLWDMAMNYRK